MIPTSDDILSYAARRCRDLTKLSKKGDPIMAAWRDGERYAYLDILKAFAGLCAWEDLIAVGDRVYMNHEFEPGIQTLTQGKWEPCYNNPNSIKMSVCFTDDNPTSGSWDRDFIIEFYPETSAVVNISLGPVTREYPSEDNNAVHDEAEKKNWAWMGTTNA